MYLCTRTVQSNKEYSSFVFSEGTFTVVGMTWRTQAKKKQVDVLAAADMGVDLEPRNTVIEVCKRTPSPAAVQPFSHNTVVLYRGCR